MAIPKIIHYCWFGGAEKPASVIRCIQSWKKYCPDYEICEWNESNIDITMNPYTYEAYEAKAWGFVPDFLRFWIVYNHGGIYLDTDVQIIRSFDMLLTEKGFMGSEDGVHISPGLGFGAEKGNPTILKNMQIYKDVHFRNDDGSFNRTPSPQYTTRIMREIGFPERIDKVHRLDGFACFPPEYFCPKDFKTGILHLTRNTFSIHQFDASWYSEEEQAEKKKRWKKEQKDYWIHAPNRILRKLMGDQAYEYVKKMFGR